MNKIQPRTTGSNTLEVTVTELSGKLKKTVEDTFGYVRVRGEISGFRGPHSSGHCYFALKDERARLEAVIWRGQASKLKHRPEEGLEVIASGKLTTYPGSSKYQIVIDNLEPAGTGALLAQLEERRKKLAAEGLFDDNRKQLLPYMPKVIAVITSPTGAVIRDILHRFSDRFPVHVLVWPVRVQGETTGQEVANGIHQLNAISGTDALPRPDMIIVARGGGSLEDLWGFNDEVVVRATADSMIPLISAVGHETDWTLIDYAADWRAPTPTAAAEKAVPVRAELEALIADLAARLRGSMGRLGERRRNDLRAANRGLKTPDTLLAMPRQKFDEAAGRLERALTSRVERSQVRFAQRGGRLSPDALVRLIRVNSDRYSSLWPRNQRAMLTTVQNRRNTFSALARQIRAEPLQARIFSTQSSVNRLGDQLRVALDNRLARGNQQMERNRRLLKSLSYHSILDRGFAVIRDDTNTPISGISKIKTAANLKVEMRDGSLDVVASLKTKRSKAKPQKTNPNDQGKLF
ncbi:MAG: exodeoxyribonuclease VII large subunit [Rhizobiaceae bacterium]